jgi:cytosine/creatinine deaminase
MNYSEESMEPAVGPAGLVLGGVTLADGETADVRVEAGSIATVTRRGSGGHGAASHGGSDGPWERERRVAGDRWIDLAGHLLLPAPAEPHAHLDKALTAPGVANPGGDLDGAIGAWRRHRRSVSGRDVVERATRAALLQLGNGATAIRSHVDVGEDIGIRALDALEEVRDTLRGQATVQLVALPGSPLTGAAGVDNRAALREAMARGADVVGGCPHLDPDPLGCLEFCLDLADGLGRPVDLHMDETLDPRVLWLEDFAALVAGRRLEEGATASHCVSLGVQPRVVAERVAAAVAAAAVAVVCCPQTSLFLQGRGQPASPRGLTALGALLAAGVTVAAGGDNLRDPFNAVGRGDPLETASLLVAAGHLEPAAAYAAVSTGARAAMGLPEVRIEPGFPAELLAVRAASVHEAVAAAPAERLVVHRGQPVSRTTVIHERSRPTVDQEEIEQHDGVAGASSAQAAAAPEQR